MADADEPRRGRGREARLRGMARRLFRELDGPEEADEQRRPDVEPARARSDRADDEGPEGHRAEAWALLSAMLETGDKVKVEIVRMLAREVRGYLEALELHKDLHHLMTNYSLEVHASLHLKPLAPEAPSPSTMGVGLRRRDPHATEAQREAGETEPASSPSSARS